MGIRSVPMGNPVQKHDAQHQRIQKCSHLHQLQLVVIYRSIYPLLKILF